MQSIYQLSQTSYEIGKKKFNESNREQWPWTRRNPSRPQSHGLKNPVKGGFWISWQHERHESWCSPGPKLVTGDWWVAATESKPDWQVNVQIDRIYFFTQQTNGQKDKIKMERIVSTTPSALPTRLLKKNDSFFLPEKGGGSCVPHRSPDSVAARS